MGRSALAVIVGYLVFALPTAALFALSGIDPHVPASAGFALLAVLFGLVFALIAGYVTVWIAARDALWPVLTVASLIAVVAAASAAAGHGRDALWSEAAALVLMAPAVVVGGAIRLRRRQGRV